MKKSLIALSILASVVGVAQAADKTNLYGSLKFTIEPAKKVNGSTDNNLDLKSSTSFGIKGEEDLAGGAQAIFKMDLKVDNDKGISRANDVYLGFKHSDFGQLTIGRQKTVFSSAIDYNDIFNSVFFNVDSSNVGRTSHTIKYFTPNMSGFKAGAAIVLDGDNSEVKTSDSKGIDVWDVSVAYENAGIKAAASYLQQDDGKGTIEVMGASGGYSNKDFQVGLGYLHQASTFSFYNAAGEYKTGNNTFRAGAAYLDMNGGKEGDLYDYALGYQYDFSKRTFTWIEANYIDKKDSRADDDYKVVVGVRHKF